MQTMWAVAAVLVVPIGAMAQAPADKVSAVRYGISSSPDFYPQATAKEALASVAKALENKRYEYIAAHLLDPAFVDAKVADRAKVGEAAAEKALLTLREQQRRDPNFIGGEDAVPVNPPEFAERVKAEAEKRAFQSVVRSIVENLGESPENVRLLGKFAREGAITDGGTAATVTLKDVPAKQVYLKQVGTRWYVEDRQQEEAKPKAEK
jgi:hypothetical protein